MCRFMMQRINLYENLFLTINFYRNGKQNLIAELTEKFAVKINAFHMEVKKAVPSMAEQLFDSGTYVGANVSEAQNAESRKDFIHKMKFAA